MICINVFVGQHISCWEECNWFIRHASAFLEVSDNYTREWKAADTRWIQNKILLLKMKLTLFLFVTSLALETIPSHRDYRTSLKSNKEYLRMVMCLYISFWAFLINVDVFFCQSVVKCEHFLYIVETIGCIDRAGEVETSCTAKDRWTQSQAFTSI